MGIRMTPVGPQIPGAAKLNLRKARRLRVLQQAKIVIGADTMIHCEVRDISPGGARIAVRGHLALPEAFDLFVCAQDLRVYSARLRWRDANFVGVSFGIDDVVELSAEPAPMLAATGKSFPALTGPQSPSWSRREPRPLGDRKGTAAVGAEERNSSGARPARASVEAGHCGWERRRRSVRRSAF
jgi:hypothetical protein